MRRGGLEGAGEVRPGIFGVHMTFNGLGHDLNLGNTLATLTMSGSNAVGTCIATTDDEYVLSFGRDALIFRELHSGKHTVLLRQQFEGEVYALQFTTRCFEIAGSRSACGDYDGVVIRGER